MFLRRFFKLIEDIPRLLTTKQGWFCILVVVAAFLFIINVALFYPGYMSPDSFDSLDQISTGVIRDWHPPLFTLIWAGMLLFTKHVSSMMIGIVLIEWVALFLLAWIIYRLSKRRLISLAPFVVGLSPLVLAVSGVVWKDVLMTNMLLLGSIFVLMLKYTGNRARIWILTGSLICFLVAFLLRYNVFPALVPLVWFAFWSYGGMFHKKRVLVSAMVATLVVMPLSMFTISYVARVQATHPEVAVMVDDILHVNGSLGTLRSHEDLVVNLRGIQDECARKGDIVVNNFVLCANADQKKTLTVNEYGGLRSLWTETILHHPMKYVAYRMYAFEVFLFSPEATTYVWQDGISSNQLGIHVKSEEARQALKLYVLGFGYKHFSFSFEAWFWVVMGALVIFLGRRSQYRVAVITLVVSGLLYIASYIPTTVASDYRYIYWSVISITVGGMLLLAERYRVVSRDRGAKSPRSVKIRGKII